jgi:NAD(P)H-dependent FMN reductase
MTEGRCQLALIVASVRQGRLGPVVANWLFRRAEAREDFAIDTIDLAELNLPANLSGDGDAEVFAKRIETADAIVVVTPEYNHGYPGALKTAIDTVRDEWRAKPVGFVSYGGISGGLRAVEQLRLVFAELQMVPVRNTVSFQNADDHFAQNGGLPHLERADAAADALLGQLAWWARALRHAKAMEPLND